VPNKKQDMEEIGQVPLAQESESDKLQAPTKPKRATTRKKAQTPKEKPDAEGAPDAATLPEEQMQTPTEAQNETKTTRSTPTRKEGTGARKSSAKKATEPKDEPQAPEQPAKASNGDEQPQEPTLPLLDAPNSNLPVEAPPQDVGPAVPPIDFSALTRERRSFWGRLLLLLAVGVVLGLSVLIFVYRPTVYSAPTHSIRFLYRASDHTTQVVYDGEPCKTVLSGELTASMYDTTGSICAAAVGGKLYLVQGDEVEEIAPDVQDFLLSQNGAALVYRSVENVLYYRQLSGAEVNTVTKDCRDAHYCLSPDGEMLFYTYVVTAAQREEGKAHAAVFSLSGEKPYFPETTGILPVAIADDFEHIFYYDKNGDLYYMNADSEISLCRTRQEGGMQLFFDREFEELLLRDARGMMLWQDGKETMIPQLKSGEILLTLPNQRAGVRALVQGTQYLMRSFDDNYYLKKGEEANGLRLSYLDAGVLSEVAFINEAVSRPVITDKGVFYLEHRQTEEGVRKDLYFCPPGETAAQRLAWDVEDFCVNSDGSRILHKDFQGALYAARVSGTSLESERLSDYVDRKLCDSNATDMFYYYVDGALFVSDNGDKPDEPLFTRIEDFSSDAHTTFFFERKEDGSFTVYTKHRNRKVVQIASGITDAD